MSLAGAQHKLAVVIEDGKLYEPVGARASTHILKPDHPDEDYPHSVINEWFSMSLAKAMGLAVPAVEMRSVPEPIYLIERFDREKVDGQWQRSTRSMLASCSISTGVINTARAVLRPCPSWPQRAAVQPLCARSFSSGSSSMCSSAIAMLISKT